MTAYAVLASVVAGTAGALAAPGVARRRVHARMVTLVRSLPRQSARRAVASSARGSQLLAAGAAGVAVAWFLGGPAGLAAGTLASVLVERGIRRLPTRSDRERAAAVAADLPLALNLVASCLQAGSPLGPTVEVVGSALGGPLGEELVGVAVSLRLGSPPERAWSRLAADPTTRPVARAVVRVSDSGAALAALATRLADEQRDRMRLAADAAARRAGVLVVAPLGLCFLPAFLLLGVAPVVIGLASLVLG